MTDTPRRVCKHCPCAASPSDYRCPHCRKGRPCPAKTAVPTGTVRGTNATAPATGKGKGSEAPTASPLPPFAPFPDGGVPADLPAWAPTYLATYAQTGGHTVSASAADVTARQVNELTARHPRFAEARADALQYYADMMARELPGSGKPIGLIARLKSIRPQEYETALIVQNVTNNNLSVGAVPPDIEITLAKMRDMSDLEWRCMNGEVFQAPAALPPPTLERLE